MDARIKFILGACLLLFTATLVLNVGVGMLLGFDVPLRSDAVYFLELAQSLVKGDGYCLNQTFWPGVLSARRLPGWPWVIACATALLPGVSAGVLVRVLAMGLNAIAASSVGLLAFVVTGHRSVGVVAGCIYALHPMGLFCAYEGLSEPLFVLMAVTGVLLVVSSEGRRWRAGIGACFLGCAVLVRASFILFPAFVLPVSLSRFRKLSVVVLRQWSLRVAVLLLMFGLPPFLWMLRNAAATDQFPVLSTIRGQTFYGGNNSVVAGDRRFWGYWVFPDSVPGETTMRQLAARGMSEMDVDEYYWEQGKKFLVEQRSVVPQLLIGKLVRAYMPIPWDPSLKSWAASVFRLILYAAAILGLCRYRMEVRDSYRVVFYAMFLTNLATVLAFYGSARFAFAFEPFLMPFAGLLFVRIGRDSMNRMRAYSGAHGFHLHCK